MKDSSTYFEIKSSGEIFPKQTNIGRTPYNHQKEAMSNLDCINRSSSYSTLIVLPTGGGKTYTASMWLLKNAIDNNKKILWIAHRQMLLDQAADSFMKYAYAEIIPHISSFRFRIVSGSSNHDSAVNIDSKDNLLVVSKDSIGKNLQRLDCWLKNEEEVYLIIDEAHHSTAKTYRKVIKYVKQKVKNVKLIGLTATPFRTAENEKGLLSKIYSDGVKNGIVFHNDIGITYQIGLKELIKRQILSKPVFEDYYSDEQYGLSLGIDALGKIQHSDMLPPDIMDKMQNSAGRNKLIVETYKKNQNTYGQTIVFTVSVVHAIQLAKQFNKAGIKADYVVSNENNSVTGVTVSRENNERKIEAYRQGKLQVLTNVNILTEGVDLPQTKTVFLARPTVSTVLMTQMVGRALRGVSAGGTPDAYIVSFIDKWNDNISWVNPETLFEGSNDFVDNEAERVKRDIRLISIEKIEEFASILDDNVDTSALEKIPFEKRIPVGMYAFTYLEENGMDHSYQVMVYDSTLEAYRQLMESLPALFESFGADEEYLSDELLAQMEMQCKDTFFCGEMIPPYEKKDVINILKFYAQKECVPSFYTFDEVEKNKLDISEIAHHIWEEDMGTRKKAEYLDSIWNSTDDNLLRLFFGRKLYFLKQIDIELLKISEPNIYNENNVVLDKKQFKDMTLYQIGQIDPEYERELRVKTFEKSITADGSYQCACCGMMAKNKIPFQVDHIVPMGQGGKTVPENLQILCRRCNGQKGDK